VKKLAFILFLLICVAGGAAAFMYQRVRHPYRGYTEAEQFVDIPSGSGTKTIGEHLVAAGVIRDQTTYRMALWLSGHARRLKAGEYRFDQPMTPIAVIDKIARGEVYIIPVTFPEGLTIAEMSTIFESHGLGPASAFVQASKNAELVRPIDPVARNLEGYLFPDTYPLSRHTDAARLVHLMMDRFHHVFTPEMMEAAAARGLTVRQAVTLASLVEKETARPDERPVIAAVYQNRLRIGMALACDPTVIYALQLAGKYTGNLRREDLSIDSPYNTYRRPGLPPGPIAAPGRASLNAAVHPADADFLYFVSRNDGSHEFARTLDEHNRNVQKYQVEYFREKRTAEGQVHEEQPRIPDRSAGRGAAKPKPPSKTTPRNRRHLR
jgi:peptidoglycan lytic transglycosylase G